jgi:3-hydroxyacyl-CoA dehydrogenase/enoyl-CoA hydratase/3-hydroxybutyryl-CoA epimerase
MAVGLPQPKNFVGMHFFNPVNRMPLVEVIRGVESGDRAVATVYDLAKKMGKIPVVVKDGPGFLVNRLLLPYLAEAAFLLSEGMAIDRVDSLYVKDFGMPMGPFQLMDEIGIDVCLKVLKSFRKSLGARVEISPIMEKLGQTERLGKKGGKGFYQYDEKAKRRGVDVKVYSELGLMAPKNPLSNKECLERGIFVMINEAALVLNEERVVETPRELDLAMIMGTGFPPFRGGLLRYADSLGSEYIVNELEVYASQYGDRFRPSTPLSNMAKTKRTFYS